jgi:hypothetical protein
MSTSRVISIGLVTSLSLYVQLSPRRGNDPKNGFGLKKSQTSTDGVREDAEDELYVTV